MTEETVAKLKQAMALGIDLFYRRRCGELVKIIRIVDDYPKENESGPCAFLAEGWGTPYIALDHVEPHNIVASMPLEKLVDILADKG